MSSPHKPNQKKMADAVENLLLAMGVDISDPNFIDTPSRVARMYAEMLTPEETKWTVFPAAASDMIIMRGHRVIALCPHHLMPVELTCHVGYIPRKQTLGLSKLARVVESHLTRPIMQEDLGNLVANTLDHILDDPKGIGVVLAGVHGCMRFRGVETPGDVVTSTMRGVLLLNPAARSEFLQLIGRP